MSRNVRIVGTGNVGGALSRGLSKEAYLSNCKEKGSLISQCAV